MKTAVLLTAVSLVALSAAGLGQLHAATGNKTPTEVSETVSGGATTAQDVEMSEHGLAAMNDIHLARVAINDGYVDSAKKLLDEAHTLLGEVASEDAPVTVTTEVKVGDKPPQKETVTAKPDLIPILSELQVVEAFADQEQDTAAAPKSSGQAAEKASDRVSENEAKAQRGDETQQANSGKQADHAAQPSKSDRIAAVGQAREQLSNGDREGAIETLRLVDLGLVSRTLSMPLADTNAHVDKAIALLDAGKLHEANLELKQAKDGLVADTVVMFEPADAVAADQGNADKTQPASQASTAAQHRSTATAQVK